MRGKDACSGKDWPRNPIPPNLFSACPKFRNSPGFWGEFEAKNRHQNAKISFNKGKVWKRGEETWLERLRAKTVCAPPPPPCLFPLRCTNSWYLAFVVVSNDCPGIALSSIDNCINFFFFYLYSKDVSFAVIVRACFLTSFHSLFLF